ncbi:MAG: DUF922 domain-containing protein [Paracoccaceae bacterium]
MKITASIPKPTVKHFNVKGKDLDKLFDSLEKNGFWGRFLANEAVNWGNKDPVETVKLSGKPVILMPKWADYSKADKDAKTAFDKMYKVLLKHENNHYAIFLEQIAIFSTELGALEELAAKDAKKKWKTFLETHLKAQKKYDDSTHNGEKEGVAL